MAEFIQLNKPTEPKPASQNREHHHHPPPAKKIRQEEKIFKAKKMNGGAEQQNYSSKPKNKKTKTEKDRDREKDREREKEKGKEREKERKKHKLAAENHLSVKKENGELKLSQKGIDSRFAAAQALFVITGRWFARCDLCECVYVCLFMMCLLCLCGRVCVYFCVENIRQRALVSLASARDSNGDGARAAAM